MRRLAVVLVILLLGPSLFAKEVYLAVTGKANGFYTDARIFNPSFDKDITIQAWYLPAGGQDNSAVQPKTLTIPKRTMQLYDDAVQSMFGGGAALGAIRLRSDDDFIASQRIYQDARASFQKGTLGQFVNGLELSAAKTKGVLLQLKSGDTTLGPFRTNWGGVNPNATMAHVTMKLYDRNNAVIAEKLVMFEPYAVLAPANIVGTFNTSAAAELSDAWISFTSDVPVFLYGSCVDSSSSDPTYIAAADDSGTPPPPPPPPPPPATKTVHVHAEDGFFDVSGADNLQLNDKVRFVVTGSGGVHGFRLFSPSGDVLFTLDPLGSNEQEVTITLEEDGSYQYLCTRISCSVGHTSMFGAISVGDAPQDPGDRY